MWTLGTVETGLPYDDGGARGNELWERVFFVEA